MVHIQTTWTGAIAAGDVSAICIPRATYGAGYDSIVWQAADSRSTGECRLQSARTAFVIEGFVKGAPVKILNFVPSREKRLSLRPANFG